MKLFELTNKLPKSVLDAFLQLGYNQRGRPEHAMLVVQETMGGGVLSFVVEHVGDLTHRMTHMLTYGSENSGQQYIEDKTRKCLRVLTEGYGFDREFRENVLSNARYRNVSPDDLMQDIKNALHVYATEHEKLIVYNRVQWLARQSAINLGYMRWNETIETLTALNKIANSDEYGNLAIEYQLDANGNPLPYEKV